MPDEVRRANRSEAPDRRQPHRRANMKETTAHQDEAEHAAQAAQTGQTQDGT